VKSSQRALRSNVKTGMLKQSGIDNGNPDDSSIPKHDGKPNTNLGKSMSEEQPNDHSAIDYKNTNNRKSYDKEMDSGAESSSSRRASRRGRASAKKTKSPLAVEIKKVTNKTT